MLTGREPQGEDAVLAPPRPTDHPTMGAAAARLRPSPAVVPAFDWIRSPRRQFEISLGAALATRTRGSARVRSPEMISDFPRVMSEIRRLFLAIGILLLATGDGGAERINQEGRILGPAPQVARPTLFNTPEADAVVSAMQIMPVTNPWN